MQHAPHRVPTLLVWIWQSVDNMIGLERRGLQRRGLRCSVFSRAPHDGTGRRTPRWTQWRSVPWNNCTHSHITDISADLASYSAHLTIFKIELFISLTVNVSTTEYTRLICLQHKAVCERYRDLFWLIDWLIDWLSDWLISNCFEFWQQWKLNKGKYQNTDLLETY